MILSNVSDKIIRESTDSSNMAPRVVGIDPGTRSFDIFGLEDEEVFLDESIHTSEVDRDPECLVKMLLDNQPLDAVVGPSGYGVPLKRLSEITDEDLFYITLVKHDDVDLSVLTGLTKVLKRLKMTMLNIYLIPGVIHLPTVPTHRKLNAIDMGTADKLCCAVLAIYDYSRRHGIPFNEVSLIMVEIGFGFNAGIAIENGRIVDGIGGSRAGPAFLTCGSLDMEVAYLLGSFSKNMLFTGGLRTIIGDYSLAPEDLPRIIKINEMASIAYEAFIEGIEKMVRALNASVKEPQAIIISGRLSGISEIYDELEDRLSEIARVERIVGFKAKAKSAAQGAALIADGLAGGRSKSLIDHMKIAEASGTVLDYVYIGDLRRRFKSML